MSRTLQDLVNYHGDRLFDGAIDLDWFIRNPKKSADISTAYVFHGKQYHDVNILDKPVVAGKQLTDTITMVNEVLTSFNNPEKAFMLAIAGYGAGKSHFALMLANLLGGNDQKIKDTIIDNIRQIDPEKAKEIRGVLDKDSRPVLVIPINGMRNCNLQQEFFTITKSILERDNQSLNCLNKFDARFENLKLKVLDHRNQEKMQRILKASGLESVEMFIQKMDSFDRVTYLKVKKELELQNEKVFEPQAEGELKDLIPSIAAEHCGLGKHYRSMLILFDEFGKYMAFAAAFEQRAGTGIMQQLFEGVQAVNSSINENNGYCSFMGFSQLDLNEYQQSTSMDLNTLNNMKRYVSRFEGAEKYYLSVSFESLVANLIEIKVKHPVDINNQKILKDLEFQQAVIGEFFQSSKMYPVWNDFKRFTQTVILGCWPLSPLATWTLSYVSSVNTVLQQRSALNILGNVFKSSQQMLIDEKELFYINAVDLYDAGLGGEFYLSESNSSASGQLALKQEGLFEKYGAQFSDEEKKVIKAIVLSIKLGSFSKTRDSAIYLLSALSGINSQLVKGITNRLEEEYNVIEYDSRTKLFEIKTDAPSIHELEKILNKKVQEFRKENSEYSELRSVHTNILSLLGTNSEIFPDIETPFSSIHKIDSLEWSYKASVKVSIEFERDLADDDFIRHGGVESGFSEPRGKIFYFIIPNSCDIASVKSRILKWIESYHEKLGWKVPLMCLVIHDVDGVIFETSEKITAIDSLSQNEKSLFGNMLPKLRDKFFITLSEELTKQKTAQHYVSIVQDGKTLKTIGLELFQLGYSQAIPFPVDGFTSSSGNGPNTIKKLIIALVSGGNNWKSIVDSCNTLDKKRAFSLLQNSWKVVDSSGLFLANPDCQELASLYNVFDEEYQETKVLNFANMMDMAIRAPYGANASAASLIVIIYYAAHSLQRDIQIEGSQKKLSEFFIHNEKTLFDPKTKGIKFDIASKISMFPIVRDDTRWNNLIRQWMNSSTASELIRFQDESQKLIDQKIKLPDDIYSQYHANLNRSADARQFQKDWKVDCEELLRDLKIFTSENQPIVKVIYALNEFLTAYRKFTNTHANLLSESDKESIDDALTLAKAHISLNLGGWIEAHPFPEDYEPELYKKRSDGYRSLIEALNSIGMGEQKELLKDTLLKGEEKYSRIINYYKTLNTAKKFVEEIKNRFENIQSATVQNLEQSVRDLQIELNQLQDFDIKNRGLVNLNMNNICEYYKDTIKIFNNQLVFKKEAYNNLFSVEISDLDGLESVEREVRSLLAFYVQDKNEEALHDMLIEIKLLRDAYNKLSDYNITWEQLNAMLDFKKKEIYEELDGDGCFDDDSILDSFYAEILQKRLVQSQQWLNILENELKDVKDVISANKVMSRISVLPVYLAEEHRTRVDAIQQEMELFLVKQKVEYILSLYRELNEEQKQVLLKQLVSERKAEKGKI
jgi:hypothetical protein